MRLQKSGDQEPELGNGKPDGIWNSEKHETIIRTIRSLGSEDHNEYMQIKALSEGLLNKYTRSGGLTEEQIKFLDQSMGNWWIDDNGAITSEGSSGMYNRYKSFYDEPFNYLTDTPIRSLRLGHIEYFSFEFGLERFESWTPKSCHQFRASRNKLRSLVGGPESVSGSYLCDSNKIASLKGSPTSHVSEFDCSKNNIKTLKGMPPEVDVLVCSNNLLTSLEGCTKINRKLECRKNKLVSMKGAPINLNLRNLSLDGNPVSEKTLKAVFKSMKVSNGNYELGLAKIWDSIPQSDQILMYKDNFTLSEKEMNGYAALKNYINIENMI
jgi:hypothetical protein